MPELSRANPTPTGKGNMVLQRRAGEVRLISGSPPAPYHARNNCPLYGLQGATADPGFWAHWNIPARMGPEVTLLLVYAMFSRVRGLVCLVSSGFYDKIRDIIEKGPPEM